MKLIELQPIKHINGNKVLDGSLSGKEITVQGASAGLVGTPAGGMQNTDVQGIFQDVDPLEISKLGEGTFEIRISHADPGDSVTIDLVDKSHFNGGKKYIMDSFTFDNPGNNETFQLGGATIEVNDLDTLIEAGESAAFEFTNEVTKDEDGVILQVGANKNQSIGISIGTMRSRELGLVELVFPQQQMHKMQYNLLMMQFQEFQHKGQILELHKTDWSTQ